MNVSCTVCGRPIAPNAKISPRNITSAICDNCLLQASGMSDYSTLLEIIGVPVLLMQGNPRQVVAANQKALALFEKKPKDVEGHRGGQVFDCIHSFTEAGCGKDANCEDCNIKNAIIDTFTSANSHNGISSELLIKKANSTRTYVLQVSTEKLGDLVLVSVERYADANPAR